MKFKFEGTHEPNRVITLEFEEESIDEIIFEFERFLRGCGYFLDDKEVVIE